MQIIQVSCDGCARDLSSTGNCQDYRLVLKSESLPQRSSFVTLMAISPPIGRPHHFCSLRCLDRWRSHEAVYRRVRKEQHEKWVDDGNGHRDEDGEITSWTCAPSGIQDQWHTEAREVANIEVPLTREAE